MKSAGRYVSNLDLKLLGAKFLTIPDSHCDSFSQLSHQRRSRDELPSILKSHHQDSPLLPESLQPTSRMSEAQARPPPIRTKHSTVGAVESAEINKYRSLISKIKKDNQLLHREITNLYRDKKLEDAEPKTKTVKQIVRAWGEPRTEEGRTRLTDQRSPNQIYERLNSQDNPYRGQSLQIQKKLSASNLHKNFEAFLHGRNKRVPDFIKNIR